MTSAPFNAGPRLTDAPVGDPTTQAVASLRGYAYQLFASALAWLNLKPGQELYLEVARDYAVAAKDALSAVEVKDTIASSVTINSQDILDNLDAFVDLVERNPSRRVDLRFLSTSSIAVERSLKTRSDGQASLLYWRQAAAAADIAPLRKALLQASLSDRVRKFIVTRDDEALRNDLLRRIHWDCGRQQIDGLALELEGNIERLAAERWSAPAAERKRLSAVILHHVLMTIIIGGSRLLTTEELGEILAQATSVTLSRRSFDTLTNAMSDRFDSARSGSASVPLIAPGLFEPEDAIPLPRHLAERRNLTEKLAEAVRKHGMIFLSGGTGAGKTVVARLAGRQVGTAWSILDFRDQTAAESHSRLQLALRSLSAVERTGLILDDLNEIEAPAVRRALTHLLAAMRRQDVLCLVTAYLEPTARTLAELGLDRQAVLAVPDLELDEVRHMVGAAGGDGAAWAEAVYVGGAFGHPQLVQAIIAGLSSRSWPLGEMKKLLNFERSLDVEAERTASRRQLVGAVPAEASVLLFRLSLLIGRFDRSLALELGDMAPPVQNVGMQLDGLIGPWIEHAGSDHYRISPLLQNAGHEMLSSSLRKMVHFTAAETIVNAGPINVVKADAAMLHAILGNAPGPLTQMSYAIMRANNKQRKHLSEWMPMLRSQRMDRPIYPDDLRLSLLLRFAQILLIAATGDARLINEGWLSLQASIANEADPQVQNHFEYLFTTKLLFDQEAAGLLDNWVDLVFRFEHLSQMDPERGKLLDAMKMPSQGLPAPTPVGMLFIIQMLGVRSVHDLADVFRRVGKLTPEQRTRLLADTVALPSDFSLLVNRPWLLEHKQGAAESESSAKLYHEMANQASGWGYRDLAIRCHVARGIMLDEYGSDPEAALEALDLAQSQFGDDPILLRARAKIFFRRSDHTEALALIRGVADVAEINNPTERTFMLREAAICAAETGEWSDARQWFGRAHAASSSSAGLSANGMDIGLQADEALAAYKAGDLKSALQGLNSALDALQGVKPDLSVAMGYRHRVIRHAVLWLYGTVTGTDIDVEGRPSAMLPGMCSNPEPSDLSKLQLGSIEYARYLLAKAEVAGNVEAGIDASLRLKLGGRSIPAMEIGLRHARLARSIVNLDHSDFAVRLISFIEARTYLAAHEQTLRQQGPLDPGYGEIPNMTTTEARLPEAIQTAEDAVLIFGIMAAVSDRAEAIDHLCKSLGESGLLPGATFLASAMAGRADETDRLESWVASQIRAVTVGGLVPDELYLAGVRFAQAAKRSNFGKVLASPLAVWMKQIWTKVLEDQQFNLRNPAATVPAIRDALDSTDRDLGFVGRLIIAAQPAVHHRFDQDFRDYLRTLGD